VPWPWKSNKGTIVRHPADFYPERCAWFYGVFVSPPGPTNAFIALFNNSNPAVNFRIYAFIPGSEVGGVCYLATPSGKFGAAFSGGAQDQGSIAPLITNGSTPPGSITRGTTTPPANTQPFQPVMVPGSDFLPALISAAPLAIVSPGYSAIVTGFEAVLAVEASLFYMWD
jgi:hypothetical protein